MFPGQGSSGTLSVSSDGTLHISAARRSHEGYLTCSAVNAAGSASHRITLHVNKALNDLFNSDFEKIHYSFFLQVLTKEDAPPPVIQFGPSNQTLPLKSNAQMMCRSVGANSLKWTKDGVDIIYEQSQQGARLGPDGDLDKRITIATNGSLFIDGKNFALSCHNHMMI